MRAHAEGQQRSIHVSRDDARASCRRRPAGNGEKRPRSLLPGVSGPIAGRDGLCRPAFRRNRGYGKNRCFTRAGIAAPGGGVEEADAEPAVERRHGHGRWFSGRLFHSGRCPEFACRWSGRRAASTRRHPGRRAEVGACAVPGRRSTVLDCLQTAAGMLLPWRRSAEQRATHSRTHVGPRPCG